MADGPYRVLGVSSDSSDAEIKREYRKLARQYHPDRNPDDAAAEEKFKAIQSAYEEIGTAESRRDFDQRRRMEEMFQGSSQKTRFGRGFGGIDFGDIFSQFSTGQSNRFADSNFRFGDSPGNQNSSQANGKGADIEAGLDISLNQSITGTEVKFSHRRLRRCSKCNGISFATSKRCAICNGTGVQTKGSTLTIKVPPGTEHGHLLRLRGMGHEHPQGDSGDLLITIRLDADEGRKWENGRLIQEVQIPYSSLILGGKVRITTPSGKRVEVEVPKGTRIGDRRRLKGYGHDGGALDIEFSLSEVEDLSNSQIEALSKLKKSGL